MEKSLALVVGNAEYTLENHKLTNAVNDAADVANKLETLGYQVLPCMNCTMAVFMEYIILFGKMLREEGYKNGLFYFSGHGLQIDEENFLTAIDTSFADESSAKYTSIKLNMIIDYMQKANLDVKIIILDACRDNPLPKEYRSIATDGLAPIYAPKGSLIAFSTSPGERAKDGGAGRNSIYTGALLRHIDDPFIQIEELFKRVRSTVYGLTSGKQTSWEHTSLIGDYYFNYGQKLHSPEIPYRPDVVQDGTWKSSGSGIDLVIEALKTYDFYKQEPGFKLLSRMRANEIEPSDAFLLGRNILQTANGGEFTAVAILKEQLSTWLNRYTTDDQNHVLNGMLFEMYFGPDGNFRNGSFKDRYIDELYALQSNINFKSSFVFIRSLLVAENYFMYIPSDPPIPVSIEMVLKANPVKAVADDWGLAEHHTHEVVSIRHGNREFLVDGALKNSNVLDSAAVIEHVRAALCCPSDKLRLNTNIPLQDDMSIKLPSSLMSVFNPQIHKQPESWPAFESRF